MNTKPYLFKNEKKFSHLPQRRFALRENFHVFSALYYKVNLNVRHLITLEDLGGS